MSTLLHTSPQKSDLIDQLLFLTYNSLHSNARIFRHVYSLQHPWSFLGFSDKHTMAITPPVCWYIRLFKLRPKYDNFLIAFCYLLGGVSINPQRDKCRGWKTRSIGWCKSFCPGNGHVGYKRCHDVLRIGQLVGLGSYVLFTRHIF
jgi:hypothetical protein